MILLLGGSGFVGAAITEAIRNTKLAYLAPSRAQIDYYQPNTLAKFIKENNVQFLINAAGFTGRPNVDACENQKAQTLYGNAVLPGRISDACRLSGISWGHVSSGCIFSGEKRSGEGFTEEDTPNFSFRNGPCSFYSGAKALGEECIENDPRCYVWRLRIPFSHVDGPRNYLSKLLRYDRLLDARNSLTHLPEFAQACVDCWIRRLPHGTYNLTNPGSVTTREVAALLKQYVAPHHEFYYFRDEKHFMTVAMTPRSNCKLSSAKAINAGLHLAPIREALVKTLQDWQPETTQAQIR